MKSLQGRIATQHLSPKIHIAQENTKVSSKTGVTLRVTLRRCSQMFADAAPLLETWDSTPVTGGRSSGKIRSPPLRTASRCIALHRHDTGMIRSELRCARVALSSLVIYEILVIFLVISYVFSPSFIKKWIPNGFRMDSKFQIPKKHIGFSFAQTLQTCDKHPQTSLKSHVHLRNLYWFPSHTGHTHVVYHLDLYDLCGLPIFYPCLPSKNRPWRWLLPPGHGTEATAGWRSNCLCCNGPGRLAQSAPLCCVFLLWLWCFSRHF